MSKREKSSASGSSHYLQPLEHADDEATRQKAAAVQAIKARKLRDKLFAQRMEELAAELCAQYVQSAAARNHHHAGRSGSGLDATPRSNSPLQIPPEVLQAKIAKLQEEIHAAVAQETDRASSCSAARVPAAPPRASKAQQGSGGGVLISRGLRGRNESAGAEKQNAVSLTARLRSDGSATGIGTGDGNQSSLPRLRLTRSGNAPTSRWDDDEDLFASTRPESPSPLSIATVDQRFREPSLFLSLDVLLDGNTKVLSARTPRTLNQVERALRVVPEVPNVALLGRSTDYLATSPRNDIRALYPERGYLADLLERIRRIEEEEQQACARRAETGWSPRDALASDASRKRLLGGK